MLREYPTLNPGASRNKIKRLLVVTKIGGGDPSTGQTGNVMACEWNPQPINTMNRKKKKIGIENTTKRAGTRLQGIVETQMETVTAENASLCPHICSLHCAFTVEFPTINYKNNYTLQPVKLEGQGEAHPSKWSQIIYYLICLPLLILFLMALKSPGLKKHISKSKSSLSGLNFSSSWRYNIGYLLMDYMADSPVWFTVFTSIITSNPFPYTVV